MGGGYQGDPGRKNRGGLTKEVIIALLIAVAAIVFVVILFVVSGKKSSSQKDNNSTKSSTQAVAEATTQAATEETQATTAATTQATVATTAATQSQNTTTAAMDNTFIFSDSNSRKLTKEEVLRLSAWDTKLAKNEIYARHNRKFDNQKIQAYFDSQQWYHGTVAPSDFDEDVFNEYEKANVELLKKAEDGTLTASTSSGADWDRIRLRQFAMRFMPVITESLTVQISKSILIKKAGIQEQLSHLILMKRMSLAR